MLNGFIGHINKAHDREQCGKQSIATLLDYEVLR